MFRFEDPQYLYILVLIPILALIHFAIYHIQKKKIKQIGDYYLIKSLMPNVSKWRPITKFWLLEITLGLMIIMLARPQFGTKIRNEKRVGIETIIALDISNSMLAEDVEPNRLERSKMIIENLVDNFSNDKIGLVVFAGEAFVQLPITSDYVSAKMFLNTTNPSLISVQGTDIARAIDVASNSFTQQEGVGKALIVITDGENHEGGIKEAVQKARKKGINIFILGIGSTNGSPIPIPETNEFITDNSGNVVVSALNENMCREIASMGDGTYIHVGNNGNVQNLLDKELDKLSKKEISSNIYSDYDEQFQAVALLILFLLIIEVCINECKNPHFRNISLFGTKCVFFIVLFMSGTFCANAQTDRYFVRKGNKQYHLGEQNKAEIFYTKAKEKNSQNPQANYNLGTVLMTQEKDSFAIDMYKKAIRNEKVPGRIAMSFHNMGWIYQNKKEYAQAIEAYKNALRNNPYDNESRYNLEYCKRQSEKQKQNQQQNQQKQDSKDNKTDKKEKKEKNNQQQKQQNQNNNKDKMSKENAEQLLKAAMQQEKDTQEKMKKMKQQPNNRRLEKEW